MWKRFNKYLEVSNTGLVRSRGKIIKGEITSNGYNRIHVSINGKTCKYFVHRMVAFTFLPNPNNYPVVNHIDGDKTNNNIDNLEWCTHSQNSKHAYKAGLRRADCEYNGRAKLDEQSVRFIRSHYKPRDKQLSFRALGKRFGVDSKSVENAYKGKTWGGI